MAGIRPAEGREGKAGGWCGFVECSFTELRQDRQLDR